MSIATRCPPAQPSVLWMTKTGADHGSHRQRHRWYPRPTSQCGFFDGLIDAPRFARARSGDKIDSKLPRWRPHGGSAYAAPQIKYRRSNDGRRTRRERSQHSRRNTCSAGSRKPHEML
jgi:hypothetical protein